MNSVETVPKISIGMPIYNGEQYAPEAIESVLNQTHEDFELVISDNSSTDDTEQICRDFAARDQRIRYIRQDMNIGAAPNFNAVFHLSGGEFFRWHACDDITLPEFDEKCLEVLQSGGDDVAIAFAKWHMIDDIGTVIDSSEPDRMIWRGTTPHERYEDLLCTRPNSLLHHCVPVYGLMRRDTLLKTGLLRSYASSDNVFIVELAMYGDIRQVPETLFLRRRHSGGYVAANKSPEQMAAWMDSSNKGVYPMIRTRIALGSIARVFDTPLTFRERLKCLRVARKWIFGHEFRVVGGEIKIRLKQMLGLKQKLKKQEQK